MCLRTHTGPVEQLLIIFWNCCFARMSKTPRTASLSYRSACKSCGSAARMPEAIFFTRIECVKSGGIIPFLTRCTGWAVVFRADNSGLLQRTKVCGPMGAPMFDSSFFKVTNMVAGSKCHQATLRLPGKTPSMTPSIVDVPDNTSTAMLEKILNQIRVC